MIVRPSASVSRPFPGRACSMSAAFAAAVIAAVAVSAQAQRQFEELGKQHLPVDSDSTRAVAFGDVDGDGDLDMVCGNGATYFYDPGQQNRLYLNDGTGTFTDATAARMPVDSDWTFAVALGDVDGDGDLDLVCGNTRRQNRLYLNDGTGTFTDVTAGRLPVDRDGTRAVALGDVDGDGDLDLVCGNGFVSLNYPYPWQQNRLYLNDGTGSFTDVTAARLPVDNGQTRAVALGDIDGDGDLDLICGNGHRGPQNGLYLNDGTGTFIDATAARLSVDRDDTRAAALVDVDLDGDLDLICGNFRQQDRLYLNDGTGTFTDATAGRMPVDSDTTRAMVPVDVDLDGDLDLFCGNYEWERQNRLYLNDGTGTFTDATAARMPADIYYTQALAVGDVDVDGDLDLVCGNYGQENRLYLNDGTGTFTDATRARIPVDGDNTLALALGDIDVDGDLDLVCGNGTWQRSRLYLNDGTGTFTDSTPARMPVDSDYTRAVVLGDVDGDGDLDLFCGNYGQQNRLYLNDGTGTFTDATAARMPADRDGTVAVVLGDVDGDGDFDLVFGNFRGQNRLYLNDGTGTFTDASAARMPVDRDGTFAVALGDVDADGDLDLVCGNSDAPSYQGQQNRLYLNDGTGTFTDATAARMPVFGDDTRAVALGDVDVDGDLDLVCGNAVATYFGGLRNRLYLNDGTGTFTDATAARMPVDRDYTLAVALGDVDADGDLDLVFGNVRGIGTLQNRLYLNLLRQLDAPFLLRVGHIYRLDVYARYGPAPALDAAVPFVSAGTATIPLPPLGTLGLDPTRIIALPPFVIPQPSGIGSVAITVPNVSSLAGGRVHAQALLVQYPVQARLTNVTTDVFLR